MFVNLFDSLNRNSFVISFFGSVVSMFVLFLFFLQLVLTTEAMGALRFAGASLSQSETVNAGAKPAERTSASRRT
jgi:hypothetical protein